MKVFLKGCAVILKSILQAALLLGGLSAHVIADTGAKLEGAGATFPAPLYKEWIKSYQDKHPATTIHYAVVGSGEGVSRFLNDIVDFGASDVPLSSEQLKTAKHGAVMIPATAGMISLTYNLPGLNGQLKLSRSTYVALMMGRISRWNDARIQASNPGLNLPDREIILVVRRDGSGTTFLLTKHMSSVSEAWSKAGPGVGKLVNWPSQAMQVNGNEGVAARVKLTVGAIGYVEYGFAKQLALPMAALENREGHFVAPSDQSGIATIAANPVKEQQDMASALVDPIGANAYPIIGYSWLMLKKDYTDGAKATALKHFVAWGLEAGQAYAPAKGYIKLPSNVVEISKALLGTIH
jgi:phosphate transport system substrate-binding protein